jgi:hypothetical protein
MQSGRRLINPQFTRWIVLLPGLCGACHGSASGGVDAAVPDMAMTVPDLAMTVLHTPVIDGDWWQVAGNPDLGSLNAPGQQPVDFALWQAADGTYQIESCIRFTSCPGDTRLLYRWEGQHITDSNWSPQGIAMQSDPAAGEVPCGLQAPYVFQLGGLYHMLYGDQVHICHATSSDGKIFTRVLDANGRSAIFSEGPNSNTRDPMLLPIGALFYAYYTAWVGEGADFVRTSSDLVNWSDSTMVAVGGAAGTGGSSAECPFVVHLDDDGMYYLFRTQRYGADAQTSVYRSDDPTKFGVNDDRYLIGTLPIAAPEIHRFDGQWYIAALRLTLDGIRVAKLKWMPVAPTL